MTDRKVLATTTTGELFLPSRVIYRVHDPERLLRKFRELRCMVFDKAKRRWLWQYEFEAEEMGFPPAYDAIPPDRRPLVLASCHEAEPNRLHVYVRSTLRLTKFLVFFNKHVQRRFADGEFFDECNVTTVHDPGRGIPAPEDYFRDESKIVFLDVDAIASDPARSRELLDTQRCLEPLERHRLTAFYEDGEEHMVGAMRLRELLAMEQHRSDKPIRPFDVILDMMKKSAPATEGPGRTDPPSPSRPVAPSGNEDWTRLPDEELVRLMFTKADQLPMEFAREATLRGERLVPLLASVVRHECNWHKSDAGWCAPVHATYLLGAIGGEDAIDALMDALRLAEAFEEDWVTEELPSIFGSLGLRALEPLRAVALDSEADWMLRHTAMSGMAAVTLRRPEEAAEVFQMIGRVAGDEAEDDDVRAWAGQILLHFSRREHKTMLLKLVESGIAAGLYGKWDVRKGMFLPQVAHYRHDWLEFYRPERISDRRRRRERGRLPERDAWREALSRDWGADPDCGDDSWENPYDGPDEAQEAPEIVLDRLMGEPVPKVGRNEPCPCGSGKKFKKCCLNRPVGHA